MRPVVDSVRRKLCGPGKGYPGGVLKSAMQRLEQGDVVTATQLARLTRHQTRFMCWHQFLTPVTYFCMCLAIRHLAIFLKPK